MKRGLQAVLYLVCSMAALVMIGCVTGGTKVTIKNDNYSPGFRSSEIGRKGKAVIMSNFINQAANTTSWGYHSADKKVTYEATAHLESYLWSCFQKAFQHAGLKVQDQYYGYHLYWWGPGPGPARTQAARGITEFQLVLKSMTDQECTFQILLFKNSETKFQKDFIVKMPPASTEDAKELEKRAYRMVDQMVTAVFRDREFQKVF